MWNRFWNRKIVQIAAIIAVVTIAVLVIINIALRTMKMEVSESNTKINAVYTMVQSLVKSDKLQQIRNKNQDSINRINAAIARHLPNILPVPEKDIKGISSKYGELRKDLTGKIEIHTGTDYRVSTGTEIMAMADGIIMLAKWDDGWGQRIMIDHGAFKTSYSHLSKLLVKPGEMVFKGQVIGLSGNSGNSTGPHLDVRGYYNGKPVDIKTFF